MIRFIGSRRRGWMTRRERAKRVLSEVYREFGAGARLRGPGGTSEGLLHGIADAGRAQNVEPIASVVAPLRVSAEHQSLLHFVGQSTWSDKSLLAKVRELVVPAMGDAGPDRGLDCRRHRFCEEGRSFGRRQYCGRLGKTDNCRVAVTLSIANHRASLPIAYRLYLPEEWANDAARRSKAPRPRRREVRDQAGDRAETDQGRAHGGCGARRQF